VIFVDIGGTHEKGFQNLAQDAREDLIIS